MKKQKLADSIWTQLLDECKAMSNYAFSQGMQVPPNLMKLLESYTRHSEEKEVDSMSEGKPPFSPEESAKRAQQLTFLHNKLSSIISPAKPGTVLLMEQEVAKKSPFLFLGRVPFIRRMMFTAIFSLLALIVISMSSNINNKAIVLSIFENSGESLLLVQMLFLAAAALGASFTALFTANKYIVEGTFDPKYETSYWIRFVVGLISGIVLTQLIPLGGLETAIEQSPIVKGDGASATTGSPPGSMAGMIKITLALLGGFSANLVYSILNRLVETIRSFIEPKAAVKVGDIENGIKNTYEADKLQQKASVLNDTLNLQKQLLSPDNQNPEKIQALLHEHIQKVTNSESNVPHSQ